MNNPSTSRPYNLLYFGQHATATALSLPPPAPSAMQIDQLANDGAAAAAAQQRASAMTPVQRFLPASEQQQQQQPRQLLAVSAFAPTPAPVNTQRISDMGSFFYQAPSAPEAVTVSEPEPEPEHEHEPIDSDNDSGDDDAAAPVSATRARRTLLPARVTIGEHGWTVYTSSDDRATRALRTALPAELVCTDVRDLAPYYELLRIEHFSVLNHPEHGHVLGLCVATESPTQYLVPSKRCWIELCKQNVSLAYTRTSSCPDEHRAAQTWQPKAPTKKSASRQGQQQAHSFSPAASDMSAAAATTTMIVDSNITGLARLAAMSTEPQPQPQHNTPTKRKAVDDDEPRKRSASTTPLKPTVVPTSNGGGAAAAASSASLVSQITVPKHVMNIAAAPGGDHDDDSSDAGLTAAIERDIELETCQAQPQQPKPLVPKPTITVVVAEPQQKQQQQKPQAKPIPKPQAKAPVQTAAAPTPKAKPAKPAAAPTAATAAKPVPKPAPKPKPALAAPTPASAPAAAAAAAKPAPPKQPQLPASSSAASSAQPPPIPVDGFLNPRTGTFDPLRMCEVTMRAMLAGNTTLIADIQRNAMAAPPLPTYATREQAFQDPTFRNVLCPLLYRLAHDAQALRLHLGFTDPERVMRFPQLDGSLFAPKP